MIMKPFPFEQVKYQQYRNTFLQNVLIAFDFGPSNESPANIDVAFKEYAQSFFGLTITGDNSITSSPCSVSKKDMTQSFLFSNKLVSIQIAGKEYKSFSDTAIPQVFKLRHFFSKVLKINSFTKVGIRKVNVWNFKNKNNENVDLNEVKQLIFSQQLRADLSSSDLNDEERKIPNFEKCQYQNKNTIINIRTALLPPGPQDEYHHLILDILGELTSNDINVENVVDFLMDLNSEIFDSYHWSISPYVIDVMNKEPNRL